MNEIDEKDDSILAPKTIFLLLLITVGTVLLVGSAAILLGGKSLTLLGEIAIILPAAIYVIGTRKPFVKTFRLNPVSGKIILLSIFISLSIFVLGDALDRLVASFFPMPQEMIDAVQSLMTIHSVIDAVILFSAAVIFAGFAEEMLFRGLLQRTLEHYREPAIAIVLTAVLFALAHFLPWTALQITFLGLILGFMAWKSDSVFPSIILHGTNNLLSILFMNMNEDSLKWYASGNFVSIWWTGLALVIFIIAIKNFSAPAKTHKAQDNYDQEE